MVVLVSDGPEGCTELFDDTASCSDVLIVLIDRICGLIVA
jgi:hypothetical protein